MSRISLIAVVTSLLLFMIDISNAQTGATLTFIGQVRFATDTIFEDTQVGGLSGLEYIPLLDRYIALSDDHGSNANVRMYELGIDLSDGTLDDGDVVFTNVTTLLNPDGLPVDGERVDPEAIRFDPTSLTLYWASEGNANDLVAPSIREMTINGRFVRELSTPQLFWPTADHTSGVRHNLAFESLSLSHDGNKLFTATENALNQDGPSASVDDRSPSRMLEFDLATGVAQRQFIYVTDPVTPPTVPVDRFNTNGLVAILAVSDTRFIMVERSLSLGPGFVIKLYLGDIANATDVSGLDSIEGEDIQVVEKQLLLDLTALDITLDNIEGITFGPELPNGERSLILVSDNNFQDIQLTQFLAFSVAGEL
ncbi:esterase-like activity of phytase family protein [Candidatus Entotheonella palauensis]|uniref:Phytase-like domain-containing protein n=1 Tax=Candidatus Entotheonella gemina TaxID=1429439 RepID=W4M2D2_9BACT|nr:esterase-like activity of phytase family protein [Candidatus Entotheonella palauensis]ETX04509.1 MAG: hypothetical protein ETSY2_28385 [Candidatus Entotheonella gemina]